jgi:hypothetical protein
VGTGGPEKIPRHAFLLARVRLADPPLSAPGYERPMISVLASTALALIATAAPSSKDAGGDDDEFRKTFGTPKKRNDPAEHSTVYIPPVIAAAEVPAREKLRPRDIMEVVLAAKMELNSCVEGSRHREKAKIGKGGKILFKWTIGLDGKVSSLELVTEELKDTYLASCIRGVVKRWVFPKHTVPGDPVVFPFKY